MKYSNGKMISKSIKENKWLTISNLIFALNGESDEEYNLFNYM